MADTSSERGDRLIADRYRVLGALGEGAAAAVTLLARDEIGKLTDAGGQRP